MGKNKIPKKVKKDTSVFKVAGSKVTKLRNKPKPVTTKLKKLSSLAGGKNKTVKTDAQFAEVKDELRLATDTPMPEEDNKKKMTVSTPPPDIAETTEDFSKL